MSAPASLAGKRGKCPSCQTAFTIGGGAAPARAQPAQLPQQGDPLLAPLGGSMGSLLDDLPPLAPLGSPAAQAAAPLAAPAGGLSPGAPAFGLQQSANPLGITPESQHRWREAEAAAARSPFASDGRAAPPKLMIPAIGMILFSVFSIGAHLFHAANVASNPQEGFVGALGRNGGNQQAFLVGTIAGAGLGILLNVGVIAGAVQMLRMKGWGMAKSAAMIACIPFCSFMCLNVPLGIWALVVLNQDDVKRRFT